MARTSTSRRRFLTGMGAAGVGGASLLSLLTRHATAQGVAAPKRLLVMYSPNCNQTRYWVPTGGAYPETGQGVATLHPEQGQRSLRGRQRSMTLIDGINVSVNGGDLHSNGQIRFMTGKAAGAQNLATVPSIDQLLLNGSPALATPQFKSLELICDTRSDRNDLHHRIISYGMELQAETR